MATSDDESKGSLFECSNCHERLCLDSKTLPCLHSLCVSCLDVNFKGLRNGENGHCPVCEESVEIGRLSLSSIVTKSLRRQHLEMSTKWLCDLCSEDGTESVARNWCHQCQKLLCNICNRFHKKLHRDHTSKDLDEIESRDEAVALIMNDLCDLHLKNKDCYCNGCNDCLCNMCYKMHPCYSSSDSAECCRPVSLSVKEEVMKRKSQEGPALNKEMDDFEEFLRNQIKNTNKYSEELIDECNSECNRIWEDFEKMKENAIKRLNELCADLRRMTDEQVGKWRHLLKDNENILKQLEIWRINLKHLLSESPQDVDVACGLRTLRSKLSSRLENPPSGPGDNKYQLTVTFSKWWPQFLYPERIASVSLEKINKLYCAKSISMETESILQGLNPSQYVITSIHVSKEDDHIFLCDFENCSIMEFTEGGELLGDCVLREQKGSNRRLRPHDIYSISSDTIVVLAGWEMGWGAGFANETLIFLERKQLCPFLEMKKIIETGKEMPYLHRLCERNGDILICDQYLNIDSFNNEGKKIKQINTGEIGGLSAPLICGDSSNGNFWLVKRVDSSSFEIFCFDQKNRKIHSMKIEEKITDFCFNELGNFFCNFEGIFSFFPEKKIFFKFEKKSEVYPRIFIVRNKIYIYLRINGKDMIKIFKIFC